MQNRVLWGLLLVLIIATFFRIYQLTETPPGLYPDEAMNGNNALEALRAGDYKVYYPENNGREGLLINIQAQFLRSLLPLNDNQPEPWMLRLPSAIFGILTVLGLFFLGRELFGYEIRNGYEYTKPGLRVGLFASFLLATSFWHINFSRIGFRAILAPMFLVWAMFLLLKALNRHCEGAKRPKQSQEIAAAPTAPRNDSPAFASWILPLVGGVLFGLGFHTYIAYRVMALLPIVIWYFFRKEPGFWRVMLVFLAGAFIAGLPIGLYYLQNPADFFGRTAQISIFSEENPVLQLGINIVKTIGMFFWTGDYNWRHNISGQPELFFPVAILFLIGIIIQFKVIARPYFGLAMTEKFAPWLIFAWLGLAFLPVVISSEGLPHALRSILMLPPVMLLAAAGGVYIYEKLAVAGKIRFAVWSTGILAVILVAQAYVSYFIVWANNPNTAGAFSADYVAIGRELNALPLEIPKYVVVQGSGVDVRGIPMPTQTTMFITDTFSPENQWAKNIRYVLPEEEKNIPAGAVVKYIK